MKPFTLVVNCVKKKRRPIAPELRLGDVAPISADHRLREWVQRIQARRHPRMAARSIYSGDYWSVACDIVGEYPLSDLWICSAGVGLVSSATPIPAYSATFARGDVDSVGPASDCSAWWNDLARSLRFGRSPRTLTDLAHRDPGKPMIVAMSLDYVRALAPDLGRAANELNSRDLMSIVSVGARRRSFQDIRDRFLPTDSRVEGLLGGARVSLNIRIVRALLERGPRDLTTPELARLIEELNARAPERRVIDGVAMSDESVRSFISRELQADATNSKTRLLRKFRDMGFACEQKRFSMLFESVKG